MIHSVEYYIVKPDLTLFDPRIHERIDVDGLTRIYTKFKYSCTEEIFNLIRRDLMQYQYKIPIKYLSAVSPTRHYMSAKSVTGRIEDANLLIEPTNVDYQNVISSIPINQHIPIDSIITIDVETPKDERMFLRSSSLSSAEDLQAKISSATKAPLHVRPYPIGYHIMSLDCESKLSDKFKVVMSNSLQFKQLFSVRFDDKNKTFEMIQLLPFALTPQELWQKLIDVLPTSSHAHKFFSEAKSKFPTYDHPSVSVRNVKSLIGQK